jgi:uncharacterized protein with PIN domain
MTRIQRMTVAIVESEGHRLVLQERLEAETKRANDAEKQVCVVKELMERRTATLRRRAEAAERAIEGVTSDAESTEGWAEAGGEAESPPPFSD